MYESLRKGWQSGTDLTELTGQGGGWPKYVYGIYVTSGRYGDIMLLTKKYGRRRLMRLTTKKEAERLLKQQGVSKYPD